MVGCVFQMQLMAFIRSPLPQLLLRARQLHRVMPWIRVLDAVDSKRIVMRWRVNWVPASAPQVKRVIADAGGSTPGYWGALIRCYKKDVCRTFD